MTGKILELNLDLLIEIAIQLVNTFILIFVVSKFLYKPISKMLKARENRIADEIDNAKNLNEKANALIAEYDSKLENVKKEAADLLDNAHKKAIENEMVIIKEAKDEAENLKIKIQGDIEKYKEQVRDEIRKETIEVATMMARKFIAESLDQNRKEEILNETIKEMENVKWLA